MDGRQAIIPNRRQLSVSTVCPDERSTSRRSLGYVPNNLRNHTGDAIGTGKVKAECLWSALRRQRRVLGSRAHSGNAVLRLRRWVVRLGPSNTGDRAAPFEQHHVTPLAIHAANPLPRSHNSKPGLP